MKRWTICIAILAMTLSLSACKSGSVEGTYNLDKAAMKADAEALIAKMPKEKQGMAKFGLAMIEMMSVELVLQSGGKALMKTSMPNPFKKGEVSNKEDAGTWTLDGKKLSIVTTNKKTNKETTVECSIGGKKLTCQDAKRKQSLVFVKG